MKRWIAGLLCAACLLFGAAARAETGYNITLTLESGGVLIGSDGQVKVEPGAYQSITSISEVGTSPAQELFAAVLPGGGDCVLLNALGEKLSDEVYQYLKVEGGHITFKQGDKFGVMDMALNTVIPCEYTQLAYNGQGGYAALTAPLLSDRAAGLFYLEPGQSEAATGVRIMYDLGEYSEGLMPVIAAENKKVGYINAEGLWVIKPQFTYGGAFSGGRAVANINSGVGIIDASGNWLASPKYRAVYRSLGGGVLILGELNRTTIELIDPNTYETIRFFKGDSIYCGVFASDKLAVIYDDTASRLIDGMGEVLMEFGAEDSFDAYSGAQERVIVHQGENVSQLYSPDGTPLFGPVPALWALGTVEGRDLYAYAKFDVETQTESGVEWAGAFEIAGTREVGIADQNGEILIPAKYRDISLLPGGLFAASTDDEVLVINERDDVLYRFVE